MRYGSVYLVTNLRDGKKYVGITTTSIKARWASHCAPSSTSTYLHNAILAYGKESFSVEELYVSFSKEDLAAKEKHFILMYDSLAPKGYNLVLATGFEGKQSEITAAKKSAVHKAIWESKRHDAEYKRKRMRGVSTYVQNKRRAIVSVCMSTGNVFRYEHAAQSGIGASEVEQALKKGGYCKNKYWYYDEGQSDEYFLYRMMKSLKRLQPENIMPIIGIQIETGDTICFENIYAVKKAGFGVGEVRKCLDGTINYTKGYTWKLDT